MSRERARRSWGWVHRGLGLFAGAAFALLGLTGSVLVFYLEIDEAQHRRSAVDANADLSAQSALDRLRAVHPQRAGPWRLEMPLAPGRPLRARYYAPAETADRMFAPLLITLDPRTLEIVNEGFWGREPLTWIYDLHYTLLLERIGHTLVGILGVLMLVSLASGLPLWWTARRRRWAAWQPALRAGAVRRTYDLHLLIGLYGWIFLAVLSVTGAALALPSVARVIVSPGSPTIPAAAPSAPALHPGPMIDLDQAVAIARVAFPRAEVRWIHSSGAGGEPITLRLYQPGEPSRRFPHTFMWLHPQTGSVLQTRDAHARTSGDAVLAWMHPLHNGEAFGLIGRILACIAGVLPAVAFATGLIRDRHKRRARRSWQAH